MERCKNYLLKLNIYKTSSALPQEADQNPYEQRTQVIATRVYFILLLLLLIILILFACLNSTTVTITIQNPTLDQIQSLPTNRICPCSITSFPYNKFVSSNVSFHQVCSSDFVSNQWISSLFHEVYANYFLQNDFRSVGFAQFQALASFCELSRAIVNQTLSHFGSSLFISTHLDTSPTTLRTKVMTTVNRFQSSTSTTFKSQIELISAIIMGNHFLNALGTSILPNKNKATFGHVNKHIGYFIRSYQHSNNSDVCICTQNETLANDNCRGPFGIYEEQFDIDVRDVDNWYVPTVFIPGLASSCMPVDACLLSSLECLFNQTCVNILSRYQITIGNTTRNFTALDSDNSSKPSRFNTNSRVKSIVEELMIEEWNVQESYEKYFEQCAPVACTYLVDVYPDFLTVLNTFISSLGGLCSMLGIIVLPVVKFIRQRYWPPPVTVESSESPQIPFIRRLWQKIRSTLKRVLFELNLFKTNSNDDDNDHRQIRYQILATRIYICLLLIILVILTIYLVLIPQTYVQTINNPSAAKFSALHSLYPSSLQCSCSSISIPYDLFLTVEPHYHQMCSSYLVSPFWLSKLKYSLLFMLHYQYQNEYAHNAGSQFHLLKELCTIAKDTITNSLQQFRNQTLISTQVIPKEIFELQASTLIVEWKQLTKNTFNRTLQLIRATQYGNHLTASDSNSFLNSADQWQSFTLNSSIYYGNCSCMFSPSCHSPMRVYNFLDQPFQFDVPGFFAGCFRLEALLQSTLECFHDQACVNKIADTIQLPQDLYYFSALKITDNLPNETIGSVVNKLFVEKWSENSSFDKYFQACAPQSCTYEYTGRPNLIFFVTTLLGIFSSLPTLLEIIFSILLWFITKVVKRRISCLAIKTWVTTHLTQKRHLTNGSRLILYLTIFTALAFASTLSMTTTVNEILKPSLETYEKLLVHHSDTLQCPCVRSSIPYKSFMNVTVLNRHQVCSSSFVTQEWIGTLLLPEPQSDHAPIDFRKTAISFFQLLASLCQLTEQHLTGELSDLMSRNLINTNVIPSLQLNQQIQSIIDQFQLNTPSSFLTTLQLIRSMTSDNLLIPVFETNWKWMDSSIDHADYWGVRLNTKSIVYNRSCDCSLSSQCFQESSMPGLMVGCYPLESLLKSTLQCLYDIACFSQLSTVDQPFSPLNHSKTSRYEKSATVELILNQLMVEQWFNNVIYENYYNQCAPSLCSYLNPHRRPTFQTLTLLLGLDGGLTIIMNIIARILVFVWEKISINQVTPSVQATPNVQVHPM